MNSADVKSFQYAIMNYIKETKLPLEVKRLALKEIYDELLTDANTEIARQLKEREEKKDA